VEGGAQVRVTPQGFTKLTSILPGAINSAFGSGFCVPKGTIGSPGGFLGTGANYCSANAAPSCNPGCEIAVGLNPNGLALHVTNQNTLNVAISAHVSTNVHIDGQVVGIGFSCDLGVSSNNLAGNLDIALGTRADNGELTITLKQINSFNLGLDFSGCGPVSSIGNLVSTILDSFIGQFIVQLLTPTVNNLIQGFLPNPLGIASITNIGTLVAGVSPGTTALMETRVVPGGYANLVGNGLSLGIITGINSDIDPTTRTGTRADGVPFVSEPNLCVPPLPIPDFAAAPHMLPTVNRTALTNPAKAFSLAVANDFNGAGETGSNVPDIKMGLSKTMLDQLGHHLVTSGALCLGVGTSLVKQLNVGTVGILVPSLADLGSNQGNDPLLLVTRPQRQLTFDIGDNTMASPAITIHIEHMEVDFYAFLYERYVRAFTMDLSMNVGVNLEFEQLPNMPATIKPSLIGISSHNVTVSVLNSDFVKETPAHLAMVLPSVFDLVTPLLGNIAPITVPSFAGFTLNNPSIAHVTTAQDDFIALNATLGAGFMARQLAQTDPFAAEAVAKMDSAVGAMAPQSTGTARLQKVETPSADVVISALKNENGGKLPQITFDVDRTDASGRELEWSWNFNGGVWHPYTSASPLVISDRAFAWQGKYEIGLQSRVKGDMHTASEVTTFPVTIDSVAPRIFTDKAAWDGDNFVVPVWDVVSESDVQIAYGRPGDEKPRTPWTFAGDAKLTHASYDVLAIGGDVAMWARDESGNVSIALVAPFHGQSGAAGCACNTSGAPGTGSLVLFGIVGFGLLRKRRRRVFSVRTTRMITTVGLWVGASVVASMQPGCDCGKKTTACETADDCTMCPQGQLPFCIDNTCVCSDDIPAGRVGPYSDVGVNATGVTWVSAYAQSHGDLVVAQAMGGRIPDDAWEWVDGVPDGPVTVPGSKIRGGVEDDGPNVGMYTSIQVAADGTVFVSYYDVDRGALKLAVRGLDGTWTKTDVELAVAAGDQGSVTNSVGMYTSLTLDASGKPCIAYLAHLTGNDGMTHAEVHYAVPTSAAPTGPGDWTVAVVDQTTLPPADPMNPNIYPLPEGLGLFIDSSRNHQTDAPVITYYDRANGDLKVAKYNMTAAKFDNAITLDGSNGIDVGWSPSVQVGDDGKVRVAYVSATSDDLKFIVEGGMPEIIDDGYRIVGTTVDGLPKPEFHFVGDDAGLVLAGGVPTVVYQDSTTQELLLAHRATDGTWTHESIAGATQPWPGAYGFFASDALDPTNLVLSTWVIDQPTGENWVEVFNRPIVVM
jgi:MYXO-CTERM domain-containing protein